MSFMLSEVLTSLYFSDYFKVEKDTVERYGAFNVSLIADLPLFIDPFLLFNSAKPAYQQLHALVMKYLQFLRSKADDEHLSENLVRAWYCFPEVTQTWLGFSATGNKGRGLGLDFARALHRNLNNIFHNFGRENLTRGSHLEKLCLIKDGVGRDNISDFTTNLVKGFLLDYTQHFARESLSPHKRRSVSASRAAFNYHTQTWEAGIYELPWFERDYVLLVPKDMLTKDDTWINRSDLLDQFEQIPDAIPDSDLRALVNNYFLESFPKNPTKKDKEAAVRKTISKFPQLVDYFIRLKEDSGDKAANLSSSKVNLSQQLYVEQFGQLRHLLAETTSFYAIQGDTYSEARQRVAFMKDVIENKGGHKIFYVDGAPIEREQDVHILYRLTWFSTPSDVSREVNDGRGPADFKISRGSTDKTLVEFKLASNPQLRRNLQRQTDVYERASDAKKSLKVIIYFSEEELSRVTDILTDLKLRGNPDIILVDARKDNKPSGSKA
jgi:hypothetical protein